jgi:hypothetical protein
MSRWLYFLLGLAVIAPFIDLIWGPQTEKLKPTILMLT